MDSNEKQFVIRLPHRFGAAEDMFYCDVASSLTTIVPEEATRMSEDRARLHLQSIYAKSIKHHDLFRGSQVIPESEISALRKPRPLMIYFHVRSGRSYEEGGEIKEIVRAIVRSKYPDAEIDCAHWFVGDNNFCSVSFGDFRPLQRDKIQEWVKALISQAAENVRKGLKKEVFEYAY